MVTTDNQPAFRLIPLETITLIKRDYLLGKGSIDLLSERYGVKAHSVKLISMSEKWTSVRSQYARTDDVMILKDQIADLNQRIKDCDEPKDIDSLYRAKQRALSMLWGITGHPKPPTAKPPKERNGAKDAMIKALMSGDEQAKPKKGKKLDQAVNSEPVMDLSAYTIT